MSRQVIVLHHAEEKLLRSAQADRSGYVTESSPDPQVRPFSVWRTSAPPDRGTVSGVAST